MHTKQFKKTGKTNLFHPKASLCLALNLARLRLVEVLRYTEGDEKINEDNCDKYFGIKTPDGSAEEKQIKLLGRLKKHIPFININHEKNDEWVKEIILFKEASIYLGGLRNFYSHHKHKPIIIQLDKNNIETSIIKKICDLFDEGYMSLLNNADNKYEENDLQHLRLDKERRDGSILKSMEPYISASKPLEHEYALFNKSEDGYEFTDRGAAFLASLFLDKKEAIEMLGGMTGFKKTDGNKFYATRHLFTYYSGKVIYDKESTDNSNVSLFFNMISFLSKKPEIVASEKEKEDPALVRKTDLFSHFALRYLLMYNDEKDPLKIFQYTGEQENKHLERQTQRGNTITIDTFYYKKEYSVKLLKRFAFDDNNVYFQWQGEKGSMGFKALSDLVFAKLLRNEIKGVYEMVKNKVITYIKDYREIMINIKNGTINDINSLEQFLNKKPVKIEEIPNAIKNGFSKSGRENDEEFINRILARLKNKINDCDEKLKEVDKTRIYDLVTFILQDFINSIPHGKKPNKELYKELHKMFTFYRRYRGNLMFQLKNKDWDYNKHFISKALQNEDLHSVYRAYLQDLKQWCENKYKELHVETEPNRKLQKAAETAYRTGTSQKTFSPRENEKSPTRTSNAKDIADMILNKPIPLPDNLISNSILEKIQIKNGEKNIDRLATVVDIYLPGKDFDAKRTDNEKSAMLPEYYHDIPGKYETKKQKMVRLERTHDKLLWLIVREYANGFIKDKVRLKLPDDKPVETIYKDNVTMEFFDKEIRFPFEKYNKIKKLLYDKRIANIFKFHCSFTQKVIEFTDDPNKEFKINEELQKFRKSQKTLINGVLHFEERFFEKNNFETMLTKYPRYNTHIEHNNILKDAGFADESYIYYEQNGKKYYFRNNALHNQVPETKNYFAEATAKYDSFLTE